MRLLPPLTPDNNIELPARGFELSKIGFTAQLCALSALALMASAATHAAAPDYSVVAEIAGADGGWDFADVDSARGELYVARTDAVMAVDLASNVVNSHLAVAQRAHQVLVVNGGRELLETDGTTGLARFIDTSNGNVIAEISVGKKPDAALFDAATGLVAVMNGGDGMVSLLDPVKHVLVGSILVGGVLEFGASDGRGTAWVNIEDKNELVALDLRARKVKARIALAGCDGPTGLAFVAGGTRLISACANNIAVVTDPKARKVVSSFAIGKDPDAVLYDAKRGLAFVPCGGDGVMDIISAAKANSIKIVGHVSTRISAKTAALDPRTGRIYLPSAKLSPPEPGAKRGKPIPGSFAILVVAPKAN